jgi:hypothetical protein
VSGSAAEVLAAYAGSDADRTRALYAKLSALGPAGEIAARLLEGQGTPHGSPDKGCSGPDRETHRWRSAASQTAFWCGMYAAARI